MIVAVAVVGLYAFLSSLLRLIAGGFGAYQAGGVVGSALIALVAYLLWKGRRGAWVLTLVFGTLGIVGRLVMGDPLGAALAAAEPWKIPRIDPRVEARLPLGSQRVLDILRSASTPWAPETWRSHSA